MRMLISIFQICFVYLSYSFGEEINLYGDAGEAYSIEVNIGHPHQKFRLLIDTGSTTLALASYAWNDNYTYFHADNSTSLYKSRHNIKAAYSQGTWAGFLASDFIQFPKLTGIPEVRSDFALVTESYDFFINTSRWQGLLGLAYVPVGAWGYGTGSVESWLDALDRYVNKPMSFHLKLCGTVNATNITRYGYFNVVDDHTPNPNTNKTFRTPVLRQRWYEVGVISIRVISTPETKEVIVEDKVRDPDEDMCLQLNSVKSIVDSGTTQIKLPDTVFTQVVDELKNEYGKSEEPVLDEFWIQGEAGCWPEPQVWTLPWLAIDLLSADADNQYFTLEIPPENYMVFVGVHNSSNTSRTLPMYCYKLGLDNVGTETIIGYIAMEGYQVTFNRSAGWIGFQTSDCGFNARISGPYNASSSLRATCQLMQTDMVKSIIAAQWALFAISTIAISVILYLVLPCFKTFFVRRMPRSQQFSLSQTALVEEESS